MSFTEIALLTPAIFALVLFNWWLDKDEISILFDNNNWIALVIFYMSVSWFKYPIDKYTISLLVYKKSFSLLSVVFVPIIRRIFTHLLIEYNVDFYNWPELRSCDYKIM